VFSKIGPNLGILIAKCLLLESTIVIHKTNKTTFFIGNIFQRTKLKIKFFENEVIFERFQPSKVRGKQ
jgi:hypothetical protein